MLQFTKLIGIVLFTMGLLISMIMKRYIYGTSIGLLSVFVWIQFLLSQMTNAGVIKYIHLGPIPSYVVALVIIVQSVIIMIKSVEISVPQKILSGALLGLSLVVSIAMRLFKAKFPLLQTSAVSILPSILFIIFMLTIAIIPDNQGILYKIYHEYRYGRDKNKLNL